MNRVKFYSKTDMSRGYYLNRIEELFEHYSEGKEIQDINEVIELCNVKKFIDNNIFHKSWTPEIINHYKDTIESYSSGVARFIKSIGDDNFKTIYYRVEQQYKEDFWELINKYKAYENIDLETFQNFLETSGFHLQQLLKFKNIVGYFGSIIRDYMIREYSSAELLLDKYEVKYLNDQEDLFFPKELSSADKEAVINNYIDSENPNYNYLRLIANIQSNKDRIEISAKTLLKARKKAEEIEKQLFHLGSSIEVETSIAFSKSQEDVVVSKIDGNTASITYSTKWIDDNRDYPTLLNNFIYMFEFVDIQMRCNLVNNLNRMGVLERFLKMSSKNAYIKGPLFEQHETISLLQMYGYYDQLFSIRIRLEEVIEWFFREYLPIEFNTSNFIVQLSSIHSIYMEKCTIIAIALESALKQYTLFAQEGEIDYELLGVRSEQLNLRNIPSLVNKKYFYGDGDEYRAVSNLLFSDQSGLGYHERNNKSYGNLYKLLNNVNLKIEDCTDYFRTSIKWLIDHGYITIKNGCFIIKNELHIKILKDLYYNEALAYWRYPEVGRNIIDELEKNNLVKRESSLLSRPEQDYFNYYLNKAQFNNGLDLRNLYVHTQVIDADEKKHKENYMVFLRLFVILVIKINDEFCTLSAIDNLK